MYTRIPPSQPGAAARVPVPGAAPSRPGARAGIAKVPAGAPGIPVPAPFRDLGDPELMRLLALATEVPVISGQIVIRAGERPDAVYVVLDGRMEFVDPASGEVLGSLGPGDGVAEACLLEQSPAAQDLRARENSLLLVLPTDAIERLSSTDPALAARLFRALATSLAARLGRANDRIGQALARTGATTGEDEGAWRALAPALTALKERLVAVDRRALRYGGNVPAAEAEAARADFTRFVHLLNETIGLGSGLDERTRRRLGARVQAEVLPYVLLSRIGERIYAKPRGYAGDYLTIEHIYADAPSGTGRIGPLLDRCFLDQAAGRAVQNRRPLLVKEIRATLAAVGTAHVTSLASGPAAELFDVYGELEDVRRLHTTCVDIDLQALAYVADRLSPRLRQVMRLEHANLLHLALGRTKLDLPPQDLVYSIGLVDYFGDEFAVRLLDYVHGILKPGGRCILGNFHPRNPTRALMDHVLDWTLIHRSEDDMQRLFRASAFGGCDRVQFEAADVNLFATGVRRAT